MLGLGAFARFGLAIICLSLSACSLMGKQLPSDIEYVPYTVVAGDSLFEISQRFIVPLPDIEQANNFPDPKRLQVGSVLLIPRVPGARISVSDTMRGSLAPQTQKLQRPIAPIRAGQAIWPLAERVIISPFGWRNSRFHEGLDLKAPQGTQIHAAHAGVVAYCGHRLNGYGNTIILKSDDLVTVYGHNRRNLVAAGESVERGQVIAEVGATGNATGPHLHFETRVPTASGAWQAVSPFTIIGDR